MATHDYIIANASGAAVRADLNNALAAIVSNNSNATAPATTYAYQWWADTTNNQLKLRNSTNTDWLVIQELDGTMLMEDGTAAAPGLAFADDTDTGLFRPAANQLSVATNGVERVEFGTTEVVFNDSGANVDFRVEGDSDLNLLFVDAGNDRVGIGTSTPGEKLVVNGTIYANNSSAQILAHPSDTAAAPGFSWGGQTTGMFLPANGNIGLSTVGTERVRVTSGGKVGIATTSPAVELDVNGEIRASSGMLFGTDTAAANALDDYEEGTWTPVLAGSGTAGSFTYATQTGTYTKVGNLVTVYCDLDDISQSSSGSGNLTITGLPFTNGPLQALGSLRFNAIVISSTRVGVASRISANDAQATLISVRNDSSSPLILLNDITFSGSNAGIQFTITYRVA
jgi:hypothetical protein